MLPMLYLAVASGGALGACLRFGLAETLAPWEARSPLLAGFPLATLLANALGSLLLGLLTAHALARGLGPEMRAFVGPGLLGGFTTFSAFSVQAVTLLGESPLRGALYLGLSLLLCVGGAALGLWLGRGAI